MKPTLASLTEDLHTAKGFIRTVEAVAAGGPSIAAWDALRSALKEYHST